MIPLKDNIPSRSLPLVNYGLIGTCGLVFAIQLLAANSPESRIEERYGMIPVRVLHPQAKVSIAEEVPVDTGFQVLIRTVRREAARPPFHPALTLLTCIFLHGGWMHFIGNVWVLYIFGDNVEDRFGHLGYLIFYLASGVAASATQLIAGPGSAIPTIGASGAIAGVMGAYMLLYPHAMVVSLLPLFYFMEVVVLPAPVFLGIWFVLQFFQGAISITSTQTGGVAWWAHIGGFAVGFAVAAVLRTLHQIRPPVLETRPNADRSGMRNFRRMYPYDR